MATIALSRTTPPALPRDLVPRPALRRVLDEGADRALTLVCAPPGFGKSLLLAEWVRRCPQAPAVWVSLDEEDDDPRQFRSVLLEALRDSPAVPASSGLQRLLVSRTGLDRDLLDELCAALGELPRPLRLILDDVHHLRSAPVVEDLRTLVRGSGPALQLVVASRLDPPLPLSRLRLDDELCELRAGQLRFSEAETALLFERGGVRLGPDHRGVLQDRTGGWPAGLRLAQRSLHGHPDPDRFVTAFSGDECSVSDYLIGEVLAGIGDVAREVLRRTSIADPVPAALAVELCEREDAADILDTLVRDLGLLTTTGAGRCDYRVQELLRSHLLADLGRGGDECVAALHRRAAHWWDRQGHPVQALRHASRSADRTVLTDLLHRRAGVLVARGEHAAVQAAAAALPVSPPATAWQATAAAWGALERGDRRAVTAQARRARGAGAPPDPTRDALLRTVERFAGLRTCAPEPAPAPRDPALGALVLAGRGTTRGLLAAGRQDLGSALARAHRLDLPLLEVHCRCVLGVSAWADGDLRAAADAAGAATAAVRDGGWAGTGWAACAHALTGLVALERGEAHAASEAAEAGLRTAPAGLDPVLDFALRAVHGGALFDRGEKAAGLLELRQAHAAVAGTVVPAVLAAAVALLEHRIALGLGHASAAAGAADRLTGRPGTRAERILMQARTESAAGTFARARTTLAPLLHPSAGPARPATVVEAWLVASEVALASDDRLAARQALRAALDRARPVDVVRPFLLARAGVRALLVDELVDTEDRGRFAARLLGPRPAVVPAAVSLTPREHEVLTRLPSLLNLAEIADDLVVSVNTVKSHVRSIYDKLGAGTRRTAVLAAHERGLLR